MFYILKNNNSIAYLDFHLNRPFFSCNSLTASKILTALPAGHCVFLKHKHAWYCQPLNFQKHKFQQTDLANWTSLWGASSVLLHLSPGGQRHMVRGACVPCPGALRRWSKATRLLRKLCLAASSCLTWEGWVAGEGEPQRDCTPETLCYHMAKGLWPWTAVGHWIGPKVSCQQADFEGRQGIKITAS